MTFGSFTQRVRDSILPLSVGDTLPKAFEEWSFTHNTEDHEQAIETCQLCGQEDLRYHFEIINVLTGNKLWVGSHCILRFGLSIFESGRRLSPTEAKKKLNRLTDQMRQQSCIKALRAAASQDRSPANLVRALDYYEENKFLTPKFAFIVLWRLKANRIDHSPSFFKIRLKRNQHKQDLREMPTSRVHILWPALSAAQRGLANEYGHKAPENYL